MPGKMRFSVFVMTILLLFSGCRDSSGGETLRYDIASPVVNLDPQYTTDPTARMLLLNICEGLLIREPDGGVSMGAAERYEVSGDGLVYTFSIRPGSKWAGAGDDAPFVTAHDFVFAFQRIFSVGNESPFAGNYALIKNADKVLSGAAPPGELGVRALDDFTLTITLEHPSPRFWELLCDAAALPCNREAFEKARGRYGLENQFILTNGPFILESWTDARLNLRPNPDYFGETPPPPGGVNIYIARENPAGLFLSGESDACLIPYSDLPRARDEGYEIREFENITWCVVFNQKDDICGNPLIRQGLAHATDRESFIGELDKNLSPAVTFIPLSAKLGDKLFSDFADPRSPLAYDEAAAVRLFSMGLEALGFESLPPLDFLVPDTGGHALNMAKTQQIWQKVLPAFFTISQASPAELDRRFKAGDYQLMLLPFTSSVPEAESLFSRFTGGSPDNGFSYMNPRYDVLYSGALAASTYENAATRFLQAERTILSDAVVIPVYNETTYFATNSNADGIAAYPFGGYVRFNRRDAGPTRSSALAGSAARHPGLIGDPS